MRDVWDQDEKRAEHQRETTHRQQPGDVVCLWMFLIDSAFVLTAAVVQVSWFEAAAAAAALTVCVLLL